MSPRTASVLAGLCVALCAVAPGCPESDPPGEDPTPPADDDDDSAATPQEIVHEGDFGSLAVAPGGGAAFVRRIDAGDAWVVDEYGYQTRPRLLQIDGVDGSLRSLSERAAQYLWFAANDGALYVDDPEGGATLWFVTPDGGTTAVMDDWQGLRLDASGRFVFAQTPSPKRYTLFDTTTAQFLLHDATDQTPWHITPDGACVTVGTPDGYSLWRPASDDWDPLQFPDGEPLAPSLLFDSCAKVAYVRGATVGWFDLTSGVDHPLAAVDGNLSGMALTPSPDEGRLYWIDSAGLHVAALDDDGVELLLPGQFADVERSPDGRHLALALMSDALGWCGPIYLVDLDAASWAVTVGIVCYEIVGYLGFTPGGGHVLWTDGPFSGMVSAVPGWTEVSYCPPWECWHPGVVDAGDRWLVVPRSDGPDPDGMLGPVRVLSVTKLTGGAAEVTPFFESTEAYDYGWFEFVRFAADGDTLVFGHELVPHEPWEPSCPVELRAGSLSTGLHWPVAEDVVDVEIAGGDRLLYVAGEAAPALHVVPAARWQ